MRTTGARHRFVPLFGDIHNHCGISYGHGTLQDAMENAALRLDFVSITGHAAWPDMDTADERISHIVAFHEEGFARLAAGWREYCTRIAAFEAEHDLVLFPGYEIHSSEHGDYTIVGCDHDLPIITAGSPQDLRRELSAPRRPPGTGVPDGDAGSGGADGGNPGVLIFPHHIGYRVGARGGNWDSFAEDYSPVVEILSMHGMAEEDHTDRPFLHSMGPLQHQGTLAEGLARGFRFGVLGNTDHHSAHPGSYGHGLTGVWATEPTREAIWEALYARRTWANSGDSVRLWYAVDGVPMGGEIALGGTHTHEIEVDGESAIDYVELIDNNGRRRLWWEDHPDGEDLSEAIVTLELGWGERGKAHAWQGSVAVLGAELREVMPRFRGQEVVSPLDASDNHVPIQNARWSRTENGTVRFACTSWGNMTNTTPSTHAIALRIGEPQDASVVVSVNGLDLRVAVTDLLAGSRSANLGPIDSPAIRLSADSRDRYYRHVTWTDEATDRESRWYYVRVRLRNGHWAISSPVFGGARHG
jgi:hypothetical protein